MATMVDVEKYSGDKTSHCNITGTLILRSFFSKISIYPSTHHNMGVFNTFPSIISSHKDLVLSETLVMR